MIDINALPNEGDRFRDLTGIVARVICRGATFLTIKYGSTPQRLYVPLCEWPEWSSGLSPLAGKRRQ